MNKLNAKECADSIIEDCRLKGADLPSDLASELSWWKAMKHLSAM